MKNNRLFDIILIAIFFFGIGFWTSTYTTKKTPGWEYDEEIGEKVVPLLKKIDSLKAEIAELKKS